MEAREVRNKVADYGCHCIVCGNGDARAGLEAVDLETEMQMAMQPLSGRMRLRRVRQGRKGREERKRSIKTGDRQSQTDGKEKRRLTQIL